MGHVGRGGVEVLWGGGVEMLGVVSGWVVLERRSGRVVLKVVEGVWGGFGAVEDGLGGV